MELNLLIADTDNNLIARCMQWCSLKGIALRTANSGLACLEEVRQSPPDVLALALDVPWGGADGVLQVLEEDSELSAIPVVLLDGGSRAGLPGRALPANVLGRLEKPFEMETLFEIAFAAADCREVLQVVDPNAYDSDTSRPTSSAKETDHASFVIATKGAKPSRFVTESCPHGEFAPFGW